MGQNLKPYLYIEELAEFVPWSVEAIRKKIQRGELRLGTHYFQDRHRARFIFKWASIVELIEAGSRNRADPTPAPSPAGRTGSIDIERAIEELQKLALVEAAPGGGLELAKCRKKMQ